MSDTLQVMQGDAPSTDCDPGDFELAVPGDEELLDIQYRCPECGHEWHERWSCACDSECPNCQARNVTALRYKGLEEAEWHDA